LREPNRRKSGTPGPDIPLSGDRLGEKKQSGNARRISIDEIPFALEGD
jgi:hypothetical protein